MASNQSEQTPPATELVSQSNETAEVKPVESSFKFTWDVNSINISRGNAPFIYDVSARAIKGAAIGLTLGLIFFKSSSTRRFCTYYGTGFGLGMSYPQVRHLYGKLINEDQSFSPKEKLEDLEKELELRKQVKI